MCTNANKPRLTEPMQLKNLLYYLGNIKGLQNLYLSVDHHQSKESKIAIS